MGAIALFSAPCHILYCIILNKAVGAKPVTGTELLAPVFTALRGGGEWEGREGVARGGGGGGGE